MDIEQVLLNIAHAGELHRVEESVHKLTMKDVEDKLITIALASTNGHRVKAAKMLGISIRSLHRKILVRRTDGH